MNHNKPYETGEPEKLYGNFATSGSGIFLILAFTLLIAAGVPGWLKHPGDAFSFIPVLWPGLIIYLGAGFNLYYFVLSDDSLEIKNHVFPWVWKEYRLEEIDAVGFELPMKRSEALRIWKKDGSRSRAYSGGSLRKRHWQALKKALQDRNILVRS